MPDIPDHSPLSPVAELLSLMIRLRDPEEGCPWDRRQTFETVISCTIEEAFEVAEAVACRDDAELCEELGDLLLQVVFHSRIAEEQGLFDFLDVVQGLCDKLVRRHPHVFDDRVAKDEAAVKASWEAIKQRERAAKGRPHDSAMDGVPDGLPALQRASKLQRKAARVGFDWRAGAVQRIRRHVDQELAELDEALEGNARDAIEDEYGDVLFTLVNLGRHLRLDPALALRRANRKFEHRFRAVEELADQPLSELSEGDLDRLWRRVKHREV